MYKYFKLLTIVLSILSLLALTGCAGYSYKNRPPSQYTRAPDGWGGKYCSQYPENC